MRQRNRREAKALANMRLRLDASALDIGTAALHGEPRASTVPRKARASMGLSIAVELVRRGVAEPTRDMRRDAGRLQGSRKGARAPVGTPAASEPADLLRAGVGPEKDPATIWANLAVTASAPRPF
jgi:hypothetical protein